MSPPKTKAQKPKQYGATFSANPDVAEELYHRLDALAVELGIEWSSEGFEEFF